MTKKPSAYAQARDQRIADEFDQDRAGMCPAHGCPRLWSVSGDRGKACSAHYWSDPLDWPRITEQLQRADVDRVRQADPAPPSTLSVTREQRQAAVARLREIGQRLSSANPKAWAWRLHERHQRGDRSLTQGQIETYRQCLGSALRQHDEGAP